jgi:hypothetical protein
MPAISQEQGQHFKQGILIKTPNTTTLWSRTVSQILVEIQPNVHLDLLSNLGMKQIKVTETCGMWQYKKTWILHF